MKKCFDHSIIWYVNITLLFLNHEKNLISIHGRVTATISKFSPQIFETYFRLYGRVNYTVGFLIFCKLYLRVCDVLTFILQASVLQKLYSRVVNWIAFFYTLWLGVRPNILTPSLLIGSPLPLGIVYPGQQNQTRYENRLDPRFCSVLVRIQFPHLSVTLHCDIVTGMKGLHSILTINFIQDYWITRGSYRFLKCVL